MSTRAVTNDEVVAFREDGVVCLRGVLPVELVAVMEGPVDVALTRDESADLSEMGRALAAVGETILSDGDGNGRFVSGVDHWRATTGVPRGVRLRLAARCGCGRAPRLPQSRAVRGQRAREKPTAPERRRGTKTSRTSTSTASSCAPRGAHSTRPHLRPARCATSAARTGGATCSGRTCS